MSEQDESVPLLPLRRPPQRVPKRTIRPVPATRAEADELYRPASPSRNATAPRMGRLNELGLLELRATPGPPITQLQAHEATLDALYGEEGADAV